VSGSDVFAWLLLLGLPATLTLVGWVLRTRPAELIGAAVTATGVSLVYLLVLLWYIFEVVGVS